MESIEFQLNFTVSSFRERERERERETERDIQRERERERERERDRERESRGARKFEVKHNLNRFLGIR